MAPRGSHTCPEQQLLPYSLDGRSPEAHLDQPLLPREPPAASEATSLALEMSSNHLPELAALSFAVSGWAGSWGAARLCPSCRAWQCVCTLGLAGCPSAKATRRHRQESGHHPSLAPQILCWATPAEGHLAPLAPPSWGCPNPHILTLSRTSLAVFSTFWGGMRGHRDTSAAAT